MKIAENSFRGMVLSYHTDRVEGPLHGAVRALLFPSNERGVPNEGRGTLIVMTFVLKKF